MSGEHPVVLEVESPLLFERAQLALRIVLMALASAVLGGFRDFQCGVLRRQARLVAYLASLVDEYPPFRLETGPKPR